MSWWSSCLHAQEREAHGSSLETRSVVISGFPGLKATSPGRTHSRGDIRGTPPGAKRIAPDLRIGRSVNIGRYIGRKIL